MTRKPWLEHPEIWATEAQFWTYLRGCLRRGIWEKSPIKLNFKNQNCYPPPKGYTGRAKSGNECALSGEWVNKSRLEVDHIEGNAPLTSMDDIVGFVMHLIPPKGSLQLVSEEAHKIKSYAERMGITYEQATIEKQAIKICKGDEKKWLRERGVDPASNAKQRRSQVVSTLKGE